MLHEANLQKAKLLRANLQKTMLHGANLQNAMLLRANLQGGMLLRTNLQMANLSKADMQNTVLDDVKGLSEANLQYANMEGAKGLLGNELAQADLTGTKLPKNIDEFKALETVEKTSQNARKIFFAMLLGCVYSWLTIATTTDVRLLTNTASSPLPIIGTEIPIAWFYIAAPLVLMCLYFYFHLYLLKQWEALASLPAIFPDGKRLDERAYPWLLNGLVRRHFKRLKPKRPSIAHIQEWITIFLAWWVVPITMIAFWLRYIPRHDWKGTIFHIGLIVLSVAFAIIFYRLCALTLQGKKKVAFQFKKFWGDRRFYYGVSVVLVAGFFSLLSYGAINGFRQQFAVDKRKINFSKIVEIVPWAFNKIGYNVFAYLSEKDVSEKPPNYWEINKEERLESVKGAKLKEANLINADMSDSFLVKADFRNALLKSSYLARANLQEADLSFANLQQAYLKEANLQQAKLAGSKLQQAYLWGAKLQQADLRFANLQQANLRGANLQQTKLYKAKLQQTDFWGANLQKAYLKFANLQQANLLYANLQEATFSDAILQQANLEFAKLQQANLMFANLQEATFSNAKLQEANLRGTNLQQADFRGTKLQRASFENADLTRAKNLTIEQLSKTKTLYRAKLDPVLLEQVKQCCPHLLEEPKKEKDKTK
jgi:uncharacterized protein YjbI with pentapeptide repeats